MKLRLLCVAAALLTITGGAQAADSAKKGDASGSGLKKLTIPSLEIGGGSLGVSTSKPSDPNVPTFHDPNNDDSTSVAPFVGLKFTKPLEAK